MKHSPGPWHWEKVEGYNSSWLKGGDDINVLHSIITPQAADRALISAAPELLEILKQVLAMHIESVTIQGCNQYTLFSDKEAQDIKNLIAKAEGI